MKEEKNTLRLELEQGDRVQFYYKKEIVAVVFGDKHYSVIITVNNNGKYADIHIDHKFFVTILFDEYMTLEER